MDTVIRRSFLSLVLVAVFCIMVSAKGVIPADGEGKLVKVTGKVVDKETGELLTGVKVCFEGSQKVVYSGFEGEFELEALIKEGSGLEVSFVSYKSKNIKISESGTLTVELERNK